jgi:hypothetical protein
MLTGGSKAENLSLDILGFIAISMAEMPWPH